MFNLCLKNHNEIFCVGGGDKLVMGGVTHFCICQGVWGVTNFVCVGRGG